MKKIILALLVLTALAACKDSKNDDATPAPTVIGTWKTNLYNYKEYNNNSLTKDTTYTAPFNSSQGITSQIVFTKDSAFTTKGSLENKATYKQSGNNLILATPGRTFTQIDTLVIESISTTTLNLSEIYYTSPTRTLKFYLKFDRQ